MPGQPADYDAVVLAGGGARRLGGRHKPALSVGGRPVLQRVCDAVRDAGRLVVVGPPDAVPERALVVREDPPGSGPVPALASGLEHVRASWVVVLAADMPFLGEAHVTELLARARGRPGAVLVDDQGKEQWLAGAWRAEQLIGALGSYHGNSLRGVLGPLRPATVVPAAQAGMPPPWFDCDTIGDLEAARAYARHGHRPAEAGAPLEANGAVIVSKLSDWTDTVCQELGLDSGDVDRDLVLDLARDVAHGVARPAAPLTTYLIGMAVGRGAPALDAAARVSELAERWDSE